MVSLPDNVRPYATALAKHHFWILAALVPLVLVPLLMVGNAGLRSRIAARRSQIEGKLSQARAVTGVSPHPNAEWSTAIGADTAQVRQETLDEWRRFWDAQQQLRVWPEKLGDDFVRAVTSLPAGRTLARPYLVRYQNEVRQLVRQLPARMGVEEAMRDQDAQRVAEASVPAPVPGRAAPEPILIWNPADQRRLYESFVWEQPPLTSQVLLAQEELWVYGMFCDILGTFTRGATGRHDSPLTVVDELAVGFPAAVRGDGGGLSTRRILMPAGDPAAVEAVPGEEPRMMDAMPGAEDGPATAPWHPRFSGASGPAGGLRGFEGAPAGPAGKQSEEQDFLGWIYVDFAGRPLSPAELAAAPEMQLVHLMPFVLSVVIDQKQLDRLLATLAAAPIPIDVREVRINADAMPGGDGRGMPILAGDASDRDMGLRSRDIRLELRGTVGLAAPPVEQALGAGPAAEEGS